MNITYKFWTSLLMLILTTLNLLSCSKQAVIITPDPDVFKDSIGCFAFLGGSIEEGGPFLKKLCQEDIDKILSFSNLADTESQKAKRLICGEEANPETFKKFFDSLNPKKKKSLIRAFEFFGYNINAYGC